MQAGAIFVNHKAEAYFRNLFRDAKYNDEDIDEYTRSALKSFESIKKSFEVPRGEFTIEAGGHRFNDAKLGIKRGAMKLSGCAAQLLVVSTGPI